MDTLPRFDHCFGAMGGPCRLVLDQGDESQCLQAIAAAEAEVRRLERKYSRFSKHSVLGRVNRAAGSGQTVPIDAETATLLQYAETLWEQSSGMFDPTAGILRRAWNFHSGALPDQSQLDELLPLIGWQKLRWDKGSVELPRRGMEIDFGGFVKEYASDSAAAILESHGIAHALVDLAGDFAVLGRQADGTPWQLGIRHPRRDQGAIALVSLPGGGLATSGDYERCLNVDGRRFSHILNPFTGWPVVGLASVSVAAEQCLVAGSAATVAMLKDPGHALDWLDQLGLAWLAIDSQLNCHGTIELN